MMNSHILSILLGLSFLTPLVASSGQAETRHVWEKVEITLPSQRPYQNPYTDVQVWVDLKGPDFDKRCYGFWDGGSAFRVRILATAPGRWTSESGANVVDPGLQGVRGEFTAGPWTEAELDQNPCRRGMVRPSGNGHAFESADGTSFFLLLSEGRRYQDLSPSVELLSPNRSGKAKSLDGWAYCAATASRDLVLVYFEQDCPRATLSGLPTGQNYQLHWYDPRVGRWLVAVAAVETITADAAGTIRLPPFPGTKVKSDTDWALKLQSQSEQKKEITVHSGDNRP